MLGQLNEEQIEQLLKEKFVGRIGCCTNGLTYIVPISYAYIHGYIYARTFEGMKLDTMRQNSSICFQVDDIPDMSNWKSVIAWGQFEELTEKIERNKALQILMERKLPLLSSTMAKFAKDWPFIADEDFDNIPGIVFRIMLTEKTGRFEMNESAYDFAM
jgi:nitroimidazol reductase NimA-like FMN-containing flavoprotein (pyridoxamine 5'-phosphate oxidase superfamily)